MIKSLSEKIDKFGWTLVVDVAGLDHAVITAVQWRRAISVSQHALRAELHIENIDFELN